jgi:hypothetical protein
MAIGQRIAVLLLPRLEQYCCRHAAFEIPLMSQRVLSGYSESKAQRRMRERFDQDCLNCLNLAISGGRA